MLSRLGLPSTTVWSPVKSPAARILSRVTHQFPTRIQELTIIPTGEVGTILTSVTVSHFQRKWPGGRGRLETAAPLFAVRRHVQGGQEVEQLWRRRRCWGNWHCYSSTESTASKVSGVKNVSKRLRADALISVEASQHIHLPSQRLLSMPTGFILHRSYATSP